MPVSVEVWGEVHEFVHKLLVAWVGSGEIFLLSIKSSVTLVLSREPLWAVRRFDALMTTM